MVATSASPLPNGRVQFCDENGAPLSGGSVTYYAPGTLSPKRTWSDQAQTAPNPTTIILDALGSASVWGVGSYRQIVTDAFGLLVWDSTTAAAQLGANGAPTIPTPPFMSGSFAGVLDTNGQLAVVFPLSPLGTPYFSSAPTITVTNGDSAAGPGETISLVMSTVTANGFSVLYTTEAGAPGATGVPRRVNWFAAGPTYDSDGATLTTLIAALLTSTPSLIATLVAELEVNEGFLDALASDTALQSALLGNAAFIAAVASQVTANQFDAAALTASQINALVVRLASAGVIVEEAG